jgi:hypothetical protein
VFLRADSLTGAQKHRLKTVLVWRSQTAKLLKGLLGAQGLEPGPDD